MGQGPRRALSSRYCPLPPTASCYGMLSHIVLLLPCRSELGYAPRHSVVLSSDMLLRFRGTDLAYGAPRRRPRVWLREPRPSCPLGAGMR
eukprot:2789755-Rhodomonas_salina.1